MLVENPEKLLDPNEAATRLKLKSTRTIANYRLSGRLPFYQVNGRKFLYRLKDVLKLAKFIDDEFHYDL